MRFFEKSHDGGPGSGVTGYFLIELKWLFSIVLIRFRPGSRDAFHNHAFNAITLWIKGRVRELDIHGQTLDFQAGRFKYTPRTKFHKVIALGEAWCISFRGPWKKEWNEYHPATFKTVTLTHGRKVVRED